MNYLSIAYAYLRHKPVRSLLTAGCLLIAFLLFGLLQPIAQIFSDGPKMANIGRLIVTPKHSTSDMLPLGHAHRIRQLDGVSAVSHLTWFGGYYADVANSFSQFAVAKENFLQVVPELELLAGSASGFTTNRRGAMIGKALADKYGWHVGDVVPLVPTIWHNRDGGAWEFEISAIYAVEDGGLLTNSSMYFGFDYFDDYRAFSNGTIGSVLLLAENNNLTTRLADKVDSLFKNSNDETAALTDQEYALSFARQLANLAPAIYAILSAVFFTIALLTANTIAQSIRERRVQFAVLGVLGFRPSSVVLMATLESFLLCLIAASMGLVLAQVLLSQLPALIPDMAQLGALSVDSSVVAMAMLIATGIAFLSAMPPVIKAIRTPLVDALRV